MALLIINVLEVYASKLYFILKMCNIFIKPVRPPLHHFSALNVADASLSIVMVHYCFVEWVEN